MEFWIYSDGACSGNPGPGGWAFSLCARESPIAGRVVEGAGYESATTNNRMEMQSAIQALQCLKRQWALDSTTGKVLIFSDSKLLIQGITQWIHGWKKKNWIKSDGDPVLNRDLWEQLDAETRAFSSRIEWIYVAGHAGIEGNERVDELAVACSKNSPLDSFEGALKDYPYKNAFAELPSASSEPAKKAWYLSYVGGKLEKHPVWSECEKRVKGVAGAKFKKVSSLTEEASVLASWNVRK